MKKGSYNDVIDALINSGSYEKNFEAEKNLSPAQLTAANPQLQAPLTAQIAEKLNVPLETAHKILFPMNNKYSSSIDQLIAESMGDLDLTITRDGATIDLSLPFVIFGFNDFASNYVSTLKNFVPAGVTLAVTTDPTTGNVIFTYKQGDNVDTITIGFQGTNNYASFLQSMNQNKFSTKYIQYTISDETKLIQYNEMLTYGLISSLGATRDNQLLPRTRRRATDFAKDIIEIVMPEQIITPAYSIVQNIIAVDGFQIGMNIFMATRQDLNQR